MRSCPILVAVVLLGSLVTSSHGQTTYVWTFGSTTANPLPSSGSNPNLMIGAFSFGNARNGVGGTTDSNPSTGYLGSSGVFNHGVSTVSGAFNPATSSYLSFSVTPTNGATGITVNAIRFGSRSDQTGSNSGPTTIAIRTSVDGFASDIAARVSVPNFDTWHYFTPTMTNSTYALGANNPIEFRLYGFGTLGNSSQIDWQIDDFSIGVTPVPEPSMVFALGSAVFGLGVIVRRVRINSVVVSS